MAVRPLLLPVGRGLLGASMKMPPPHPAGAHRTSWGTTSWRNQERGGGDGRQGANRHGRLARNARSRLALQRSRGHVPERLFDDQAFPASSQTTVDWSPVRSSRNAPASGCADFKTARSCPSSLRSRREDRAPGRCISKYSFQPPPPTVHPAFIGQWRAGACYTPMKSVTTISDAAHDRVQSP